MGENDYKRKKILTGPRYIGNEVSFAGKEKHPNWGEREGNRDNQKLIEEGGWGRQRSIPWRDKVKTDKGEK